MERATIHLKQNRKQKEPMKDARGTMRAWVPVHQTYFDQAYDAFHHIPKNIALCLLCHVLKKLQHQRTVIKHRTRHQTRKAMTH